MSELAAPVCTIARAPGRPSRRGAVLVGALILLCALTPRGAAAESPTSDRARDKALAVTLFREARALMEAGRSVEACPKLEESQRLDPSGGTLVNLALCHEQIGRVATAWAEFHDALGVATHGGRADRTRFARDHLTALEPLVPHWRVVVTPEADIEGLTLVRDASVVIPRAVWGATMPIDPGEHTLEASAEGRVRWSMRFQIVTAQHVEMHLPVLVLERGDEPPIARPSPPSPPAVLPRRDGRSDARKRAAAVAGAIGVTGLAFGGYFGVLAFESHHRVDNLCSPACTREAGHENDHGRSVADAATVASAVGLVGLGLGAYLYLTSAPAPAPRASGWWVDGAIESGSPRIVFGRAW